MRVQLEKIKNKIPQIFYLGTTFGSYGCNHSLMLIEKIPETKTKELHLNRKYIAKIEQFVFMSRRLKI